jgi:hypothetical protein
MNLKEIGWNGMGCSGLAQERDQRRASVNAEINPRVPSKNGNFLSSWAIVTFSVRSPLHGGSNWVTQLTARSGLYETCGLRGGVESRSGFLGTTAQSDRLHLRFGGSRCLHCQTYTLKIVPVRPLKRSRSLGRLHVTRTSKHNLCIIKTRTAEQVNAAVSTLQYVL